MECLSGFYCLKLLLAPTDLTKKHVSVQQHGCFNPSCDVFLSCLCLTVAFSLCCRNHAFKWAINTDTVTRLLAVGSYDLFFQIKT